MPSLLPGSRMGPYEILALIGAGGMGQVWRARDTRLERIVAIKVAQEKFSERFEREARTVAALNHPNICTLYDVGATYLVMEYIEGKPLQGPLPLDQAQVQHSVRRRRSFKPAYPQGSHRSERTTFRLATADVSLSRHKEANHLPIQ